jgi:hypothetical protein
MSPVGVVLLMGAGAGDGAAGVEGLGGGAGTGVRTGCSVAGAAAGGGLDSLENHFLKTPNINRAVVHIARTNSARR